MEDLRNLPDSALIDLLSQHTAKLTHLFVNWFADDQYVQCKRMISAITAEIEARKDPDKKQTLDLGQGLSNRDNS